MKIEIEKNEDRTRITPEENIGVTNAESIKKKFLELIEEGSREIILDFRRVKNIDSSGLGKILLFQKMLREKGGTLTIENVNSDYLQKIFDMVQLEDLIKIR